MRASLVEGKVFKTAKKSSFFPLAAPSPALWRGRGGVGVSGSPRRRQLHDTKRTKFFALRSSTGNPKRQAAGRKSLLFLKKKKQKKLL
jgi:hypothetical protein